MNRRNFLKSIAAALAALPFVKPKAVEVEPLTVSWQDASKASRQAGGFVYGGPLPDGIRPTFQPAQVVFTESGNYDLVVSVWDSEGIASWDVIEGTVTR